MWRYKKVKSTPKLYLFVKACWIWKKFLNQHTVKKKPLHTHTHVLVRAWAHICIYLHYQTIAKQTINNQITDSFSLSLVFPPTHAYKEKKWNILRLPDFLKPIIRICRSRVLINWHRPRRPNHKTIWYIVLLL
jgi:hypothetical protein